MKDINWNTIELLTLSEYVKLLNSDSKQSYIDILKSRFDLDAREISKSCGDYLILKLIGYSINEDQDNIYRYINEEPILINLNLIQLVNQDPYILETENLKIRFIEPRYIQEATATEILISCIDSIFIDGERFTIADITEDDFNVVLSAITNDRFEEIINSLLKNKINLYIQNKDKITTIVDFEKILEVIT